MSKLWKAILTLAGVGLVAALPTAGFIVPLVALGLLLPGLGGGALLYRSSGPPAE